MKHWDVLTKDVTHAVQQRRLGHRGRAGDHLYRARELLVIKGTATDPEGEVVFACGVEEAIAQFDATEDPEQATELLRDIIDCGELDPRARQKAPEVELGAQVQQADCVLTNSLGLPTRPWEFNPLRRCRSKSRATVRAGSRRAVRPRRRSPAGQRRSGAS
jgi:hypothetical protein